MNYELKYFKYKRKYLDLKNNINQHGGNMELIDKHLEIWCMEGLFHIKIKKEDTGIGVEIKKKGNIIQLDYVKLMKNDKNKYIIEFPITKKNDDTIEEDEKEIIIKKEKKTLLVGKITDYNEKKHLYIIKDRKNDENFKNMPLHDKWSLIDEEDEQSTETDE
jgi:hypothetical protein